MNGRRYQLTDAERQGLTLPPVGAASHVDVIRQGASSHPAPGAYEGAWTSMGCDEQRVQLAGGFLNSLLVDPMIEPFEQLYRRLPEESMVSAGVSPQRPVAIELGAFKPQSGFHLLLFDLRPDVYRFQGAAAGDTVPVEARRFSTIMGFDLTIDGRHHGNTRFELDPVAAQFGQQQAFTTPEPVPGTESAAFLAALDQSRFNLAAASSFASTAGAGLSLMPQRPQRYGPLSAPFSLYVRANQTVQIRLVVFRPIPAPIAFFEMDIAGFMLPELWVESMRQCVKPLTNASGGPGSRGGGPR
jgi:hypothetical protein